MQEEANLEIEKNKMKKEEEDSKFNCIMNEKQEKLNQLILENKNLKDEKETINRKINDNKKITKENSEQFNAQIKSLKNDIELNVFRNKLTLNIFVK